MIKILLIEDEASIREEVFDWLSFEGYETFSASNGREGVDAALAHLPNLIISDISMPELDGYGVLAELRQQPQLLATPFIFLTARADKSFMRHGMEMGADDYVTKPFTRSELLSAVHARLARHQSIMENLQGDVADLKLMLLTTMSHELKLPLASLTMVQQVIERRFEKLSKAELADLLQTLRTSTDRLHYLVQQTLYWSQIEAGLLTVETVQKRGIPLLLRTVVPAAINLARQFAYRNGKGPLQLELFDSTTAFTGDLALIKHALAEVIANALNVSLEDQVVVISPWQNDQVLGLSILDQGVGLTVNDPSQSPTQPRASAGLGLGLQIAKRIVDLHQGTMQSIPLANKGTQVLISFPIRAVP